MVITFTPVTVGGRNNRIIRQNFFGRIGAVTSPGIAHASYQQKLTQEMTAQGIYK